MSYLRLAYDAGREAFVAGEPPISPYLPNLPEDVMWRTGWEDAAGIEREEELPCACLDSHLQEDFWTTPATGHGEYRASPPNTPRASHAVRQAWDHNKVGNL